MKKTMRRLGMLAICAVISVATLTSLISPAFAKDYVKENLAKKAEYAVNDFGLPLGGQVSNHRVNATSVSGADQLYVIQAHTTKTYGDKVYFSLYYKGMDGKLYYTEKMNFTDKVKDFLDCKNALQAGQDNMISVAISGGAQEILGVYFYKNGKKGPLAIDTLTVARVDGSIGGVNSDSTGYRFREFSGEYVSCATNLNDLDANTTDTGAIWYTTTVPQGQGNTTNHSIFVVELVAGEDGYVNKNGTATVAYTDTLGLRHSRSVRFREGYAAWQEDKNVKGAETDYNHTIISPWFETSVREMQGIASGYVGNYYTYQDVSETCLRPYTSTDLPIAMPNNVASIDSITVTLDENDSLILQSVRFFELSSLSDVNYWNGAFGLERFRSWTGRLLAQSVGNSYTVNGKSSITFQRGQGYDYGRLETYARGQGPMVDNSGTGVGVTLQIADTLGAGIETFLAWNGKDYSDKDAKFNASGQFDSRAGKDARKAWYNLNIFRQECMTLTVRYKDVLGASRQVDVPLATTYLVYILKENQGKLSGGSWETWISGIFQQNENVALPMKLAQYGSLEGISLTYGSAPWGFTSVDSGRVDAGSDPLTIENICFYEGVNGSNFTSKYDSKKLACILQTSLSPAYSYSVEGGQRLNAGSTASVSVSGGSLVRGGPEERDYSNKYLVKIKTADIETAGTKDPIYFRLDYTDANGDKQTSAEYSLATQVSNFYGANYRYKGSESVASTLQYERHLRRGCVSECVVELPNAATIDDIYLNLQGSNEWQIEYVNIFRLTSAQQRWGERKAQEDDSSLSHLYWRREYEGAKVAEARQSVLLYQNNPTKTIYFTTYDDAGTATKPEQGVKNDTYLTELPSSMTYEEAKKDLGLSVVKYTYQVNVTVADVEDAGSSNYFYFQLLYENGTSGVVLANQQLSSDSFRRGMTESFQIKTTQNYGDIKAIRIICDNTSSTSNVFDKLNIEQITVTLSSDSGVSKSWMVKNVGWIDITYVDEGSDTSVNGLEELSGEDSSLSNVEIVKEFAVNGRATAVDLLFCITTDENSAGDSSNPYKNALGGTMEATLIYRDSNGVEQQMNFDLSAQIQQFNDTENTRWLYRPNHNDRFVLPMTDIKSVQALHITRTGGSGSWVIKQVSIQQVGGMGPVYLSPTLTEYCRDFTTQTDLALSTNSAGVNYVLSGSGSAAVTFTNNTIDLTTQQTDDSWSSVITREPTTTNETLNIYLYPGSVAGLDYAFTPSSPPVRATVQYTTVYGGAPAQKPFNIGMLGSINGENVLFAKNLDISAMSTINSLRLSSTATSGAQPYISHAVVERIRDGVVMGTYYFNFANAYLGNGPQECAPSSTMKAEPMTQRLFLQPAADQSVPLTAETHDIAVALRYTSALDPSAEKTVYRSPYVYLTDAGYKAVTTGERIEVPFQLGNVGRLVGLSIVSTGPVAAFDNAVIYNYAGDGESQRDLLGTAALADSFSASSMSLDLDGTESTVAPVLFRFVTAPEEAATGAGTSGTVSMTVNYVDTDGLDRSMTFSDLLSYRTSDDRESDRVIRPGSTTEIALQLSNAAWLNSVTISAGDRWLIASASAELTTPNGVDASSLSVNNWASDLAPLTIDLRSADHGGIGEGNQIQTFSVTGRGRKAGIAASASAGGTLLVRAYPGDTVDLIPTVTAVGKPDTGWNWNMGAYTSALSVNSDQSALFRVPGSLSAGDSCTFSVSCSGDSRLSVAVTIVVEEQQETPLPNPSSGGSGEPGGAAEPSHSGGTAADGADIPPEPDGEPAAPPEPGPAETPEGGADTAPGNEPSEGSSDSSGGEPSDENSTESAEEPLEGA